MVTATHGRAFGKVILLGEHVVVYGVPALAVGIDRGAAASSEPQGGDVSTLHLEGPGFEVDVREDDVEGDLPRAFRALLEATRASGRASSGAVRVFTKAELPAGGGLGCSAAFGVAIARALDPSARDGEIRKRASAWERVFHGTPSGIDAAVATLGGCVHFERIEAGEKLVPVRLAGAGIMLAVGHTGVFSSTKTMVESVARLKERRPEVVQKTFDGVRALVANARLALEAGDHVALGKLLDLNQMLLGGLFVSTPEIERMCAVARSAGALGAKLTGAGGGGSVIALVANERDGKAVLDAWGAEGYEGFLARARAGDHVEAAAPSSP